MEYEVVIGLEVHVQLNKLNTKMFTRAPYRYGDAPNTLTNEYVLALPGALPVMNIEGIKSTIKAGLILNCEIASTCKWDRKHYFYPDSPKGYQITQQDQPLCIGGHVEIELPGPSRNIMGQHRKVRLNRIHLEEDVGKLTHGNNESLVDYNRSGTGLMEIVSEPDMFSSEEVVAYLNSLRTHMLYAGVSDCDMEKGQLRCDANISIRPKGTEKLGTKVELKNLNSISGVKNGIEYEIKRQTALVREDQKIIQETRRWDAEKNASYPMRSKEEAHDYRYFPDPDLMPVKISAEMLESVKKTLPERPFEKQERFMKEFELPYTVTSVFCPEKEIADYFEEAVAIHQNPKLIANFIANDLLRELSSNDGEIGSVHISECKVTPKSLANLVKLIDEGTISKQIAQDVFIEMFQSGESPDEIVEKKGLKQTSDTGELQNICNEVIANNPKPVQQYKEGKETAINALKGQVMKITKGKANPAVVDQVLKELLT